MDIGRQIHGLPSALRMTPSTTLVRATQQTESRGVTNTHGLSGSNSTRGIWQGDRQAHTFDPVQTQTHPTRHDPRTEI